MVFQAPDIEDSQSKNTGKSPSALKSARRRRRKRAEKYQHKKLILKREKQRFANTMSSWAESFTMAATWQLKHQVAHWKSKAQALEYENNILRSMLRQYYVKGRAEGDQEAVSATSDVESEQGTDSDTNNGEESEGEVPHDDEHMEISEEFINFLKGNAEFRKKRQERERMRQLEKEMPTKLLEECPAAAPDMRQDYEKLYGANWQRIAALEMSMQTQFMSDCDRDKPVLWPTIPLRL